MHRQDNDADRAERIAALQRLIAQARENGISARSMEESLTAGPIAPAPRAAEQPGSAA